MELHAIRFRGSLAGGCLLAGLLWLVPGCAHPRGGGGGAVEPRRQSRTAVHKSGTDLPAGETRPEKAGAVAVAAGEAPSSPSTEYVLQAGDEINLKIYQEPELSGVFKLDPEGEIRHPLLGLVPLGRQTVKQAESALTKRLAKDYLVNPRVLIELVSTQSSQVVLLGEVKKPGVYPLPFGSSLTLLQAIAGAGGFTELASPDRIRIVRRTPDGHQTTLPVRVSDLLKSKGGMKDVPLEPNDVIMVDQVLF